MTTKPVLLDTHALLYWMNDSSELPRELRRRLSKTEQVVFVSAASVWEIAIKHRRGKLFGVEEYLARHSELHREWGFSGVAIDAEDGAVAGSLPFDHADPFDRMLIAQSLRLDATLATSDRTLRRLHRDTVWR